MEAAAAAGGAVEYVGLVLLKDVVGRLCVDLQLLWRECDERWNLDNLLSMEVKVESNATKQRFFVDPRFCPCKVRG